MLVIGEIIKAQGVRGELKIKPITNDITRFRKLRTVYAGTVLYQIAALRINCGFVYLRFVGIDDRSVAEGLVGALLQIDRIHAVSTDEDEFFIVDLIGCDFLIDGQLRGRISHVHQNGGADVFEVALLEGSTMLFPFLNKLNLEIDTESRTVSATSALLDGVAVIND